MAWSFRKSISLGPFRINLSSSGLGISFGVKGTGISFGKKGTHVSLGIGGLRYRQRIKSSTTTDDGSQTSDPANSNQ